MTKGAQTRQEIIDRALLLASQTGLEAVTLGALAESLHLSKSGLFAHFKSKQQLQVDVVKEAIDRFNRVVVYPALGRARGAPRLTALFEGYLTWSRALGSGTAGCLFMELSFEYDDRPGPVRELLVQSHRDWRNTISRVVQSGIDDGQFQAKVDPKQTAFEFVGLCMVFQQSRKLLSDPKAEKHARAAFTALLERLTR